MANLGGTPYGASTRLLADVAHDILRAAKEAGVKHYASAVAYGNAQCKLIRADPSGYKYLSVPNLPWEVNWLRKLDNEDWVILCHEPDIHLPTVRNITEMGYRVGISVYTMEQAKAALCCDLIKAIQVPINVLDRGFADPTFVQVCKDQGVLLMGRSLLLQGVLADGPLPPCKKQGLLRKLRPLLPDIDPLRYIWSNLRDVLDVALIGVKSVEELTFAVNKSKVNSEPLSAAEFASFEKSVAFAQEHDLLDPRTWGSP